MCSCPLTTTKNLVTCSLSSTTISFSSTVRRRPCRRTRACCAEVRTGNISLGVLPGGGDKASSDVALGGSFMQSSLLRLVDKRDQLRNGRRKSNERTSFLEAFHPRRSCG